MVPKLLLMTPNLLPVLALAFMLSTPSAQAFQCKNKVNPKRVIVMVDTNSGAQEVAAAERSACARGETLHVIPEISKEIAPLAAEKVVLERKSKKICKEKPGTPECYAAEKEYNRKVDEISGITDRTQKYLSYHLDKELERLQRSGAKLTSMIMSGHDGGGRIWGVAGSVNRYDFSYLRTKFPGLLDDVESLYLLGCYTAVPMELKGWKQILPKMKLLAGYEGRAPLIDMKAGHYYLEDMLKRERSIVHAANEKRLEGELKQKVRGIADVNAGVFVNLNAPCRQCESESRDYFYRSQRKLGPKLVRMDERECQAARQEQGAFAADLGRFLSGEMPIPDDTSHGRLREIYEFARRTEHCFLGDYNRLVPDQVLFLLFFNDVRKNFATYFAKDLQDAYSALDRMTEPAEVSRRLESAAQELQLEADWWNALAERNKTDPEGVKVSLNEELQRLRAEINKREDEFLKYEGLDPLAQAKLGDAAWIRHRETLRLRTKVGNVRWAINHSFEQSVRDANDVLEEYKSDRAAKAAVFAEARARMPTLKNIRNTSRKEVRALLSDLHFFDFADSTRPEERAVLRTIRMELDQKLYALNCLPFSWHEASARPERPVCPQ